MNKVILMGRLTRDAEMFGQKSKVARFTLAVDRTYGRRIYRGGKETDDRWRFIIYRVI